MRDIMTDVYKTPLGFLLEYYDIKLMEEFEITNMTDSPYHFNLCGSLCNCNNEVRNEMLYVLLTEPERYKRSRKMWSGIECCKER